MWLDLSLGFVGCALLPPLRGSVRSSSGSAGAGRSQGAYSVYGDKTPPPGGPR